jgi:hypothetical protein
MASKSPSDRPGSNLLKPRLPKTFTFPPLSLTNTYMVAMFLEEASKQVPPLKRNAGLRDLAQCLYLWPGDVAMELRRDALIAVELLDRYVRENLGTEIKFVGELAIRKDKASDQNRQSLVAELECVKDDVLKSLDVLKKEVQRVGSDNNFQQGSLD